MNEESAGWVPKDAGDIPLVLSEPVTLVTVEPGKEP